MGTYMPYHFLKHIIGSALCYLLQRMASICFCGLD